MVRPGIIYHKDTRGNEGFFNEQEMINQKKFEEMFKKGILKTPYCHTLHYGTSVFEGIRAVPDVNSHRLHIITFDKHIERLMRSMEFLYLTKPTDKSIVNNPDFNKMKFLEITKDEIRESIIEVIKLNVKNGIYKEEDGCYIRPIVYREDVFQENLQHNPSLGVYSLNHDVVFEIETFKWGAYVNKPRVKVYPKGISSPLRHVKAGANYGFGGRCKNWAVLQGFQEAILTDDSPERNVLEGSGENLFIFKENGDIITPELSQSILPGTKRDLVIQLAKNLSMNVIERKIPLLEFLNARSAAFTGTATGLEGLVSAEDEVTGIKKEFDLKNEQLKTLVKEYNNLITGGEVNLKNKELQKSVRTEVII